MRVLLITVGSRGDAEPFCALASALATAGHGAALYLQTDLQHLAPACDSVTLHELPFTQMDFYKYVGSPRHGKNHGNPRVRFVGIVADIVCALVLPCAAAILADSAAKPPDQRPTVIVASSLAREVALVLAAKLGIPVALIQLQPHVPTGDFPHYSNHETCVRAILARGEQAGEAKDEEEEGGSSADSAPSSRTANLESYWEPERSMREFCRADLERLYGDLQLAASSFDEDLAPSLRGQTDHVWMVNAFSHRIIPKCSDHNSPNILEVGCLAHDWIPQGWSPPLELEAFLADCVEEPPVCVGYGSMPFDKMRALMVVEALTRTGRRGVLVGSAMAELEDRPDIFTVQAVPYAWLLPRCSMMLSHGGAGVVHATLAAGIPAVISPLMGDQFFFAAILEARGLGVQCGANLTNITADEVAESIDKALACCDACREMGKAMREDGDGAAALVAGLEERLQAL